MPRAVQVMCGMREHSEGVAQFGGYSCGGTSSCGGTRRVRPRVQSVHAHRAQCADAPRTHARSDTRGVGMRGSYRVARAYAPAPAAAGPATPGRMGCIEQSRRWRTRKQGGAHGVLSGQAAGRRQPAGGCAECGARAHVPGRCPAPCAPRWSRAHPPWCTQAPRT